MPRHTHAFAVVGLGYVGLPLAQAAVARGLDGIGFDTSPSLVAALNSGTSHVDDLSDQDVADMVSAGFRASTDPGDLRSASTIVICVPTPLAEEGGPDLSAVVAAGKTIRDNLSPGVLVILESTTWPGTTEELLCPLLEESGMRAGVDFDLAFSPERIDPGNPTYGIANTPKIVGGLTPRATERAVAFYSQFVDTVVAARGTREAEMSKLLENTYRQVNIALVNEMAKFSHELGIDFWDVIRCAGTKPFGFQQFFPGPGVGGHCIPIDPGYLSHRVQEKLGYPFKFVELAQEVNRSMPSYVVSRALRMLHDEKVTPAGAKVLLLGVSYKAGIADQRESPAVGVAQELELNGATVSFYDPLISSWKLGSVTRDRVPDLGAALAEADLAIQLQPHPDYGTDVLAPFDTLVLDTRGVLKGRNVHFL